jgi:hypothetical protein
MTQEQKEILLKDLCMRLPYGVKCKYFDCCEGDYDEGTICGFERQEYIQIDGVCIHVEEVKPYLFPLSSLTEEQKEEWKSLMIKDSFGILYYTLQSYDYLYKNHIDIRGFIDMGLANDATGLNIY